MFQIARSLIRPVLIEDPAYCLVQMRFEFFKTYWLLVEDRVVAGSVDKFEDQIHHKLRGMIGMIGILQHLIIEGMNGRSVLTRCEEQRILEKSPAQMLGQKPYQVQVGCQLIQNIIHNKDYLIFKIPDLCMFLQFEIGILKDLTGFVSDQVIADIVFVFEIQIKSSFCHTGVFYDIRNRSLIESIVYKERKSGIQQGFPFCCLL